MQVSEVMPISGNEQGSHLTVKSVNGGIFPIGKWGSQIWASDRKPMLTSLTRSLHGRVCRCLVGSSILATRNRLSSRKRSQSLYWWRDGVVRHPFAFLTAMGLGAAALTRLPSFPTYPEPLSPAQSGAGLNLVRLPPPLPCLEKGEQV